MDESRTKTIAARGEKADVYGKIAAGYHPLSSAAEKGKPGGCDHKSVKGEISRYNAKIAQ